MIVAFAVVSAAWLLQTPPQAAPPGHGTSLHAYVPQRVFDTRKKLFVDFETMAADAAKADVVFVGEQHDDPNTHRLEGALLDALLRRKVTPVVSLEMFERDVQGTIDGYLAGRLPEEEMLKTARPWPRYATDYRGLVERAKAQSLAVIAANVPRRLAQEVARNGKDAIQSLAEGDRALVAADLQCPLDRYYERFAGTMSGHPGQQTPEQQKAMTERYYWSQCVKDETMAEAIAAAAARRSSAGPVVHYNGAFHSDFGLGTAERVRRRMPDARTLVVSMLPVADLDALNPAGEDLQRADYLVYTVK